MCKMISNFNWLHKIVTYLTILLIFKSSLVNSDAFQQPLQLPSSAQLRPPYKGSQSNIPPSADQISNNLGDVIIESRCRTILGVLNKLYERSVRRDESIMLTFLVDRRYFLDAHVLETQFYKNKQNPFVIS